MVPDGTELGQEVVPLPIRLIERHGRRQAYNMLVVRRPVLANVLVGRDQPVGGGRELWKHGNDFPAFPPAAQHHLIYMGFRLVLWLSAPVFHLDLSSVQVRTALCTVQGRNGLPQESAAEALYHHVLPEEGLGRRQALLPLDAGVLLFEGLDKAQVLGTEALRILGWSPFAPQSLKPPALQNPGHILHLERRRR